jgi:outer membrane protein assembly factor BamE
MNKLFHLAFIIALSPILMSCTAQQIPFVYKIDIPQGNIITDEQLDKLEPGMTQEQVSFLLGTPLLVDSFHQDQWDYIYQFAPGSAKRRKGEKEEEQLLRVYFENGVVEHFKFIEKEDHKEVKEEEKGAEEKGYFTRFVEFF